MITQENINFLRLFLLMIKVVAPVLRKVLTEKIGDQDFNRFFQIHNEKILSLKNRGIIRQKQYDVVFPVCDISKWDVTLVSCILLVLFEDSFDAKEKNAIEKLRAIKNTQSHHPTGSIGIGQYFSDINRIRTLITNLTLDFNRTERKEINASIESVMNDDIDIKRAIDEIKNQNTTDDFMDDVTQKIEQVFSSVSDLIVTVSDVREAVSDVTVAVSDCHKDVTSLCRTYEDIRRSQEEIKKRLEEIAASSNNNITTIIVGKVKLSGEDPEAVKEAERKLLADAQKALYPASISNEPETGVKRCLNDIVDKGGEPKEAHLGCLLITIRCNKVRSILNMLEYFQSLEIGQRMVEIAKDLTDEMGGNISLTACIPEESLRSAFHIIESQIYSRNNIDLVLAERPVYHKTVCLPMTCQNAREVLDVWDSFEGCGSTNKRNTLSEDLTEKVGSHIFLTTSIDRESLHTYFMNVECKTLIDEHKRMEIKNFTMTQIHLSTYLQQLEEHAKPSRNDERYMSYVKYINAFLSCFSKERIYLVGSTGEQLKLRRLHNGGNADFILCSGRLEIPIENIEERPDLRCYVKIRGDNLRPDLRGELIDGYLSADILRDVRPELFTILRAINTTCISIIDTIPGQESRVTTIGVPMKSGLGTTEFRNLEIQGDILPLKRSIKRLDRDAQVVVHLKKRWKSVKIHESDRILFHRILKMVKMVTQVPLSTGEHYGQIKEFADLLDIAAQRIPLDQELDSGEPADKEDEADRSVEQSQVEVKDNKVKATYSDMKTNYFFPDFILIFDRLVEMAKVVESKGELYRQIKEFAADLSEVQRIPLDQELDAGESADKEGEADRNVEQSPADVEDNKVYKATYSDMTTKEFVPSFRLVGDRKLKCLVEWKKRVEKANWPPANIAQVIFNTDILLVARHAPVKPDHQKDFCLSFNLAEMKLGQCLSPIQRQVYLILKSYLSGMMQRVHMAYSMKEMNFNTYCLKTAFFWVCEREDVTLWRDKNIIIAVKKVLHFLVQCLREKKLSHYFVNSNLFAGLNEQDCNILQICFQQILCEPVESIGVFNFIKEGDYSRGEVLLTADDVQCLAELRDDGGSIKHLDKFEDALIDMHRGFNDSTRDAHGKAPIKEAVLKVFDIFLEEKRQKQITNRTSNMSLVGAAASNLSQSIPGAKMSKALKIVGFLNQFVTGEGSQSMNSSDANMGMDFILDLGSMFPRGSEFIAKIGGREGVQNVLQQVLDQDVDHGMELKIAIDKYLSCVDKDEESQALELKQKFAVYFFQILE